MKKIISAMLGVSLVLGSAAFAADTKKQAPKKDEPPKVANKTVKKTDSTSKDATGPAKGKKVEQRTEPSKNK
jgi:hypothetical protein